VEQHFEEAFCIVVFIMPDSFIQSFLKDNIPAQAPSPDDTPPIIPVYDDDRLRGFYHSILPYFISSFGVPEDILELKFKELLLHMLHNPANRQLHTHLLHIKAQPVTPIQQVMETNFAYNLDIEAYARMTNRSVSSFKRDFGAVYGTSPGKWLISKKLAQAKKMLIQTDDAISSVAFDCGFENPAHFCRLFKQKTGTTPLAYRKKAGKKAVLAF
jgi:AraC family transcriptional regulator, exoenzyme S synthesis regulatory protein ExsA